MSRLRSLALTGLALGVAWAGTGALRDAVRPRDPSAQDGARLLDAVMERVRTNYVDTVDDARLWELATLGLLSELADPNSSYLSPARRAAPSRPAPSEPPRPDTAGAAGTALRPRRGVRARCRGWPRAG